MTKEYCSEVLEPFEFAEVASLYATPANSAAKGLWMKVFCHSKPTPTSATPWAMTVSKIMSGAFRAISSSGIVPTRPPHRRGL